MPKHISRALPTLSDGDTEAMKEAYAWLQRKKIQFIRPSMYQLKIGELNYYPDRGTIQIDGMRANQERGFGAFKAIIEDIRAGKSLDP